MNLKFVMYSKALTFILFCFLCALFSNIPPSYAQSEPGRYPHYPADFDGYGKIDRISNKVIVIDDTLYSFSPRVSFATPKFRHSRKTLFQPGQRIAFFLNDKRQITSVWLLE